MDGLKKPQYTVDGLQDKNNTWTSRLRKKNSGKSTMTFDLERNRL
jgi:hypothetical protein